MGTYLLTAPDGRKFRVTGDTPEGALQALQTMMDEQPQPDGLNFGENVAQAAGNGLFLGFGDEISARLNAVTGYDAATGSYGNWGTTYDEQLDAVRGQEKQFKADHPIISTAAEVGGGLMGAALPVGAAAQGASMTARVGRGLTTGAALGAAYGFGEGEGGIVPRLDSAQSYGMLGAVTGAAAPVVASGLQRTGRTVADMLGGAFDNLTNRGSQGRATRAIAQTLEKSGRSVDDIAADIAAAGQAGLPEYRLMDAMGKAGQRRASGVVRTGGEGAEELAKFLDQRQLDQPQRVASHVSDAFGFRGMARIPGTALVPEGHKFIDSSADILARPQRSAAATAEALTTARGDAANVAYSAARNNARPVDVRAVLGAIDDRIGPMQGSGVTGDGIDAALSSIRKRLAASPPGPAMAGADAVELSDFSRVLGVKQDLQDTIGKAVRAGENNKARELGKVMAALDEALEASSDGYRVANDGFAQASRVIEAVDEGAAMAAPGMRATDSTTRFRAMTPDQQGAARIGYGDKALARIEANASPTANAAKPFNSTKMRTEAQDIALEPGLFADRITRENTMWETQNRALQGSRTADNLQDIADIGPMANVGRALKAAITLRPGEAVSNLGAALAPMVTGQSPQTRKLIAEMLMAKDPAKVLAKASASKKVSETTRGLLETALRRAALATPER